MNDLSELLADLEAETESVVALLEPLAPRDWDTPTSAEPWTIADQIGHLAYFDEQAALAITDPDRFAESVAADADKLIGDTAELHRARSLDGPATLAWFRQARTRLVGAADGIDPDRRIPWYGPPMRASSFLIARLMETWAHGTDVADALGTHLPVSDRLFHIADLGVRTFSWSFANRGLEVPAERVRVALRGPGGTMRMWNDAYDACVTGPVEEFCAVVTQRRHVDTTHLVLEGTLAREWMLIAQAFAGPPGAGR